LDSVISRDFQLLILGSGKGGTDAAGSRTLDGRSGVHYQEAKRPLRQPERHSRRAKSKARAKSVVVELDQVRAKLIDSTFNEVRESGRIEVLANREHQRGVIGVIDNGTSIAAGICGRIFEPFTTKAGGAKARVWGLTSCDTWFATTTAKVSVESQPSRTEFLVVLTATVTESAKGAR
jgi:C4-dicarboxylate-specific signal transduction histidine kinase